MFSFAELLVIKSHWGQCEMQTFSTGKIYIIYHYINNQKWEEVKNSIKIWITQEKKLQGKNNQKLWIIYTTNVLKIKGTETWMSEGLGLNASLPFKNIFWGLTGKIMNNSSLLPVQEMNNSHLGPNEEFKTFLQKWLPTPSVLCCVFHDKVEYLK